MKSDRDWLGEITDFILGGVLFTFMMAVFIVAFYGFFVGASK